jgi:DNA-directed RNA polymerase specialized sigma24 family protein
MSREHEPLDTDRLIAEARSLRALARSLLGADRADDVVQDSYVAALRQQVVLGPGENPAIVVTVPAAKGAR